MLRSRLPQIARALDDRLEDVVEDGAEAIAQSAKGRVPVASGDLRAAIHVEDEAEGAYVIAGDTGVFYGHLVEHGTSHSAPRPFLIPALEENRSRIVAMGRARLKGL
jgi:HK97 gp10 family phage protein